MSTSTSSLGSSSTSSSSSNPFAPITLTGVSQYSSDLQNVLNRAVAIAEIPISELQNQDSTVLSKESTLGQMQSTVQGLASSLTSLGAIAAGNALSASSSNSSAVTATVTGATEPVTFTIDSVTSTASAASERSLAPYADATSTAVSSTGNMSLVVGTNTYPISLTSSTNNLQGLATQINSFNAGVTASVLTTANGDYLSVSANSTGATTLQIIDDPGATGHANAQWLTDTNQGSDAKFELDGLAVDQPSNTINNITAGVTFNIVGASTTPVTVSLQSDPSQLTSALQDLVTNYNGLRSALNAQEGPAAGALSGDTIVTQLESAMSQLAAYTGTSGNVRSLSDLGITFSSNGQASFDSSAVSGMSDSQLTDAFSFIGSATSGLAGTAQTFQQFGQSTTGIIASEANGLSQTDRDLQSQINTLTSQLTTMQNNLASQLSSADSLIAELQSQQTMVNASLQGLDMVLYGKNTSTS